MISFKVFLAEARQAPLYHATDMSGLRGIVKENTLWTGIGNIGGKKNYNVTFFTRDKRQAYWYGGKRSGRIIVLEFDQMKLNSRYKLQPLHNWQEKYISDGKAKGELRRGNPHGVEFEEVTTKPIKDALKYVTRLHLDKASFDILHNDFNAETLETLKKNNIELIQV